jgi:MFS transporter, DHA2 family, multidrug resistance protein
MAGIARRKSAAASGLFNMMRNLGGAFATALLATLVTKRQQFHSKIIGSSVNLFRQSVRERLSDLTGYFLSHGVSDLFTAQHIVAVVTAQMILTQRASSAAATTH